MYRTARAFSSSSRRSLFRSRLPHQPDGDFKVQRVKIVHPLATPRGQRQALLFTTSFFALAYFDGWFSDDVEEDAREKRKIASQVKTTVDRVQAVTEAEKVGAGPGQDKEIVKGTAVEESDELSEEDIVPEVQPEDAWFIPLGWAHQMPMRFYRGSDPEWQAFVAFAKDKKKVNQVRVELADSITSHVSNMRQFQRFLGTSIKRKRAWLDIDFPDGPPPEYERAGIEITDDYVAWVVRPVDPLNVSRLHSALWPFATASSAWATCSTLWQFQVARLKSYLSIEPSSEEHVRPRLPPGFEGLSKLQKPPTAADALDVKDVGVKSENALQSSAPSPDQSDDRPWILKYVPSMPKPGLEVTSASSVFKQTLTKNWRRASAPPPRGTFLISGLIEITGSKGTCVMDVRAAYDPRQSQWATIGVAIRRLQPRLQSAKGGP